MKINVGGVWKDADPRVNVSGVWKNVSTAFVKVSGVWKQVYSRGPVITGGILTSDETYYYRTFTASDTLTISGGSVDVEVIVIGGGGGGGAG